MKDELLEMLIYSQVSVPKLSSVFDTSLKQVSRKPSSAVYRLYALPEDFLN